MKAINVATLPDIGSRNIGGQKGPWPLLNLRPLHRNVANFCNRKSLQFSKVAPLTFSSFLRLCFNINFSSLMWMSG